tara:strand:- start:5361 stop:5534 length:174 start_codon:yes stop_codon:yes gene_type:complete
MKIISDELINKVVEVMEKNTNTFKESLEFYLELKEELIKIKNTQINILKRLNKMDQK